jgi:hypothetical protein
MRITHVEAAVGPGESLSYVLRHEIFPNSWHIVVADIGIRLIDAILLTATMAVFGLAWTRVTRPSISDRVSTRSPRTLSASSLPRGVRDTSITVRGVSTNSARYRELTGTNQE